MDWPRFWRDNLAVPRWIFRAGSGLTPIQKGLYVALISRAGANRVCCVSINTLAADVGCGRESVKRALPVLEGRGLLVVERTKIDGQNFPNVYRLGGRLTVSLGSERATKEVSSKGELDRQLLEELGAMGWGDRGE
jgi:hypothetical protein